MESGDNKGLSPRRRAKGGRKGKKIMHEFTGTSGSILIRTEKIDAIIDDGADGCRVLVSGQWIILKETAGEVFWAMEER
jgi:hypothetical protein